MKKSLILLFTILINGFCYSQNLFEKGYFIDNSNKRIDCLIKNIDWKNSPTSFKYKITENDEIQNGIINSVKEFGIKNTSKYIRSTVKLERSSEVLNKMSTKRNPIFQEETLFLKILVEGEANLYSYEDGNMKKYFYKIKDSDIEMLVFKSYITSENYVKKNNFYKQQLWNKLKCTSIKKSEVENLKYKENTLIRFFTNYHECKNSTFTNYNEKIKRDLFNFKLRPRLNFSSLELENVFSSTQNVNFDNEINLGFGVEIEFLLPFNHNNWSLLIEPTYQKYKSEITADLGFAGRRSFKVDYSSLEFPIGFRRYFSINESSKLFGNFLYSFNFDLEFSLQSKLTGVTPYSEFSDDILNSGGFAIGVGFKTKEKLNLELRYIPNKKIIIKGLRNPGNYKTISLILGYTLF